jgi:hypothetical protein
MGEKILRLCSMLFTVTSPADFMPPNGFLDLEISIPTAESSWELVFVYIISLFTFESSIVRSLILDPTHLPLRHIIPDHLII